MQSAFWQTDNTINMGPAGAARGTINRIKWIEPIIIIHQMYLKSESYGHRVIIQQTVQYGITSKYVYTINDINNIWAW